MPVVGGKTNDVVFRRGYSNDSNRQFAVAVKEMAENIRANAGIEYFMENNRALMDPECNETVKNFFMEGSADPASFIDSPQGYQDHMDMMDAMYENDREAMLEFSAISAYNPVMGLVFPLHKNLLMNNIFDKGAINKAVAKTPKFTITMKVRKLVRPDGTEIDMFTEQNKMWEAIESAAPEHQIVVTVANLNPYSAEYKNEMKKIVDKVYPVTGMSLMADAFSIDTAVTHLVVEGGYAEVGDLIVDGEEIKPADKAGAATLALPIGRRRFQPGYGQLDRQMMSEFSVTYKKSETESETVKGFLSGYMKKQDIVLNCAGDKPITKVILAVRRDTSSAMLDTCSVRWDSVTSIVEIPNAIPINTPISPEEVKDIQALYNEDQLTNILSLFKLALGNYKDDRIHKALDESFVTMPRANKIAETFDFAPPSGYALDFVEWRHKTFMDALDNYATTLIQVLNDPNVTISVIGNPALIRKITPTIYTYQSPSSIGPVELDFNRTIVTSDKRVYNFVASDKMRNNQNLIIVLNPRNSDRIIYCIYDYQLYLSNEIRNKNLYALPAIHAFERFKLVSYQPVQGRLMILNPTGMRNRVENKDPIGKNLMNDYTLYVPDQIDKDATPSGYPNPAYAKVNAEKPDGETIKQKLGENPPTKVNNINP